MFKTFGRALHPTSPTPGRGRHSHLNTAAVFSKSGKRAMPSAVPEGVIDQPTDRHAPADFVLEIDFR
jgi:hypothetical protein